MTTVSSLLSNPTILALEKCKTMSEIRQFHAHLIKTNLANNTFAASKLVAFYSQPSLSDGLNYALSIFFRVKKPNPFMFFTLIKRFTYSSNPLESVVLYTRLLHCLEGDLNGVEFSIPSVLKSCGRSHAFEEGKQLHGQIVKTQFWFDPFVSNSLLRMYLEMGEIEVARQVFDKMPKRDVISWNSMLTGYLRAGKIDLARELFDQMPKRDIISCNAMIDGYGKRGKIDLAKEVFSMMIDKDVVTWTSMMSSYVLNHCHNEALGLFRQMLSLGVQPDAPAIVNVLSAIADLGFAEEGKWIHAYMSANKIKLSSGFIASALIDMYAKCGQIANAYLVFRCVSHRKNIGDYNSIISGFAIHGLFNEAIKIFIEMEREELEPDNITFLGLLNACNHGGRVNEGQFYFKIMQEKYKLVPKIQHYGCIIDLYSRAGFLDEALQMLYTMPVEPDILAWKAILSASLKHRNVLLGQIAAFQALKLAPEDSSCYVLLSNIYAKVGKWDEVAKVRSIMKERGIRKIPGCSSILVEGKVYEFLVGKEMDVRYSGKVVSKIEEIISKLKLEGYKPDRSQVLLNVEEEEKDSLLCLHSEKMALAFGMINMSNGAPIHIVKNLRVCCDCHLFIKLVSRVYNRRIVVRDQNRFHHFENGSCSCNEYW